MKRKNNKNIQPRQNKIGFEIPDNSLKQIDGPFSFGFSSTGDRFEAFIKTTVGEKIKLNPFQKLVTYFGRKKEKVILSQPLTNTDELLNIETAEILKYDLILVIDTSYKTMNKTKYASTCWLVCEKDKTNENQYLISTYEYNWIATVVAKPENVMYANIIDQISKFRVDNDLNTQIAVIIDSDLDKIDDFNKRKLPIYANFHLPESFILFYANSERGTTENIENKLMKICDGEAKESLRKFLNTELKL